MNKYPRIMNHKISIDANDEKLFIKNIYYRCYEIIKFYRTNNINHLNKLTMYLPATLINIINEYMKDIIKLEYKSSFDSDDDLTHIFVCKIICETNSLYNHTFILSTDWISYDYFDSFIDKLEVMDEESECKCNDYIICFNKYIKKTRIVKNHQILLNIMIIHNLFINLVRYTIKENY
jgi:hypothetical protein